MQRAVMPRIHTLTHLYMYKNISVYAMKPLHKYICISVPIVEVFCVGVSTKPWNVDDCIESCAIKKQIEVYYE